ncbi:MAG: hypothetical protein JWO64_2663 [Hyphomicrobiales bacterium]|jgi:hypothetical protein|nr:hypothetical protein [Hyphomicrobiales bacterium]
MAPLAFPFDNGALSPALRTRCPARDRIQGPSMNRNNVLFAIIGALAVIAAVLGYQNYQERKQPEGMQITVGRDGISIDKK